jgi:hypothetical protein
MITQESMYGSILLGDLYHWELDQDGYFVVEENSCRARHSETARSEFETFDLDKITEQIRDE